MSREVEGRRPRETSKSWRLSRTMSRKLARVEWGKDEGTLAASREARVPIVVMVVARAVEAAMSMGWDEALVSGRGSPHWAGTS